MNTQRLRPYGVSLLAVGVALLLKLQLDPLIDGQRPYLFFFGAVMVSAWAGGLRAGLFATSLAAIASTFFVAPDRSFVALTPGHFLALVIFTAECLFITFLCSQLRQREQEALQARQKFEKTVAALNEAAQAKDEFLATISHDLRTPLTSIIGWADLLQSDRTGENLPNGLEAIGRSARAQLSLVEDILDLSRSSSGKLRIEPEPTRISTVVRSAVETIASAARAKGTRITCNSDDTDVYVLGDPRRLEQIFWNVMSNAVKFSHAGGIVTTELSFDDHLVRVKIADQGAGISPDFLPFVFERFQQGSELTRREHGGLGLGLAITKDLVELHGGTIVASSEGEGKGATFEVRLPRLADKDIELFSDVSRFVDLTAVGAVYRPTESGTGKVHQSARSGMHSETIQ